MPCAPCATQHVHTTVLPPICFNRDVLKAVFLPICFNGDVLKAFSSSSCKEQQQQQNSSKSKSKSDDHTTPHSEHNGHSHTDRSWARLYQKMEKSALLPLTEAIMGGGAIAAWRQQIQQI